MSFWDEMSQLKFHKEVFNCDLSSYFAIGKISFGFPFGSHLEIPFIKNTYKMVEVSWVYTKLKKINSS